MSGNAALENSLCTLILTVTQSAFSCSNSRLEKRKISSKLTIKIL